MSSDWPGPRRVRFDSLHNGQGSHSHLTPSSLAEPVVDEMTDRLRTAINRTRDYLLERQYVEGYWVGELEGDTILESEYILLLTYLGLGTSETAKQAAKDIQNHQRANGGWAIYPGGPLEISASVKAYFALKITGHPADAEYMQRARRAILDAGGVERVNSFTRFYLALLGVISYEQCPAVPPELTLLPKRFPLSIYQMSSWSRTIVVPLSIMWAHRPCVHLPEEQGIRELFVTSPEALPGSGTPSHNLDPLKASTWINWGNAFRLIDRATKLLERLRIRPLRKLALRRATEWMLERFADSDGLGAIFPPIVWSVVALKSLGYDTESEEVQTALKELDKLIVRKGDSIHLEPCKSPVWDTALTTIALRDAGVSATHDALRRATTWLLSKEVRQSGDWSVSRPECEPAGWFFEFNNRFYPDVDDTAMVVMALARCLPKHRWSMDFLVDDWSPHDADKDVAAILAGQSDSPESAYGEIEAIRPSLSAIHRGARWVLAMQNRDGGWGAFDVDNNREILTRLPFADHNAMIDPSAPDLTSRMLEMFAGLGLSPQHPALQRAIAYLWNEQEEDHCWYGRWGVNYLYGTWQTLVGLTQIGLPLDDPRIQKAASWLKSKQQADGGWGETCASYDDPTLRGQGEPTASQTAWALMGLISAGDGRSETARRGIQYLLDTQRTDGTWDEPHFTGTGFPRVFYLKYHLYPVYFPLMALSRFARL